MKPLKLVTWEGDFTQFLVEASSDEEAINKAIKANLEITYDEDDFDYINDFYTYTIDDVDFDLLCEILNRTDKLGKFGEALVFNG